MAGCIWFKQSAQRSIAKITGRPTTDKIQLEDVPIYFRRREAKKEKASEEAREPYPCFPVLSKMPVHAGICCHFVENRF
jgi:hypothetical protein